MSTISPQKKPIVAELEKAFAHVNDGLFAGNLQIPPFVIQLEKKIILRFVPDSFHVVIGSEFMNSDLKNLPDSLLHEMCHVYNYETGLVDCTSNQYHNQKFLKIALSVGFWVVRHKTQGWGITSFARPVVISCWDCGEKRLYKARTNCLCGAEVQVEKPEGVVVRRRRETFKSLEIDESIWQDAKETIWEQIKAAPRKAWLLKYACQCPGPHNSFRTGRRPDGKHPILARCDKCGKSFECVDNEYLDRKELAVV